jgi:LPS sulfotransferase NodH
MRRPYVSAVVAEQLDTDPPHDPDAAARRYVVCATPRSGSTMLCSALQGTGVAGIPTEYFNRRMREPLADRWGARGDALAYVRELLARRTSSAGVFGTKFLWYQLDDLRREANRTTGRAIGWQDSAAFLTELFPAATFVHIRRADSEKQAVSLWRAAYSGVWTEGVDQNAVADRTAPYNFRAIRRLRATILRWEDMWDETLARIGAPVIDVVYEDLVAAYQTTIASIVEQTTGHSLRPEDVPPPGVRPQSDANSGVLLDRFRLDTEQGHRSRVDDVRDVAADLAVRARTFPYGAVARERLNEVFRRSRRH